MRRALVVFGLVLALLVVISPLPAAAEGGPGGGHGGPGGSLGYAGGGHGWQGGGHGWQNPSYHHRGWSGGGWGGGWPGGSSFYYSSGGPSWSPLYTYPFAGGYAAPYSAAYWPYSWGNSSYLGPLVLPAETIYGPAATARFLGLGLPATQPPLNVIVAPNGGGPVVGPNGPVGPVEPADAEPVPPNAQAMNLARHFLTLGDTYFASQKYSNAYQRYAQAINAAPRFAEPYLHQAAALVALGRYSMAARMFKRGAQLDPALAQSSFRLETLYGNNRLAKEAHLDALAQAATEQPDDPDLLFLVGCLLHFDGQAPRAKPFFQRASQLAGESGAYVRAFLD